MSLESRMPFQGRGFSGARRPDSPEASSLRLHLSDRRRHQSRFDFIIIHESGHEWFGNSIADSSDMWIHEGWTTYLEGLYVEYMYGRDDGLKYLNGYKSKVKNQEPIITARGVNGEPPQDMYFKGALFINTLRSMVNDDRRWWRLLHDFYQHFKYQNIMTEDVVAYFNAQTE